MDLGPRPTPPTGPGRAGTGPVDVLAHEPGRPRHWVWVAAALAAVLVVGCVVGERRVAASQFNLLLSRCAAGQDAVRYDRDRVTSVVSYVTPLLQMATTPVDVRAGLAQLVEQAAAQGASDLNRRARRVQTTRVLPWRSALGSARASCTGYLDAWAAYLRAASVDVNALATSPAGLDVGLARTRAALLAAAPDPSAAARVEQQLPGP